MGRDDQHGQMGPDDFDQTAKMRPPKGQRSFPYCATCDCRLVFDGDGWLVHYDCRTARACTGIDYQFHFNPPTSPPLKGTTS